MAARVEALRGDPRALNGLLRRMPKGGDLHNHLSGAVDAERYIAWARDDGMCLDARFTLVPAARCGETGVRPLPADTDSPGYASVVDAWSMRGFVPGPGASGHDRFFATFSRFGPVSAGHTGDMVAVALEHAAADHTLYIELMVTLAGSETIALADRVWGPARPIATPEDFERLRATLRADPAWPAVLAAGSARLDHATERARAVLHCDTAGRSPGCDVTVRYLAQTGRDRAPHQVFAQFVAAFELARVDARVVGLNLVAPEDGAQALRDEPVQMSMLDALYRDYTATGLSPLRITLHAGELTPSVLPAGATDTSDALRSHIRRAVEVAHAERIGHGVDVLSEDRPDELLAEMARRRVLVEVCLTSNAEILGVTGAAHPLGRYLAAGVPVALATDDPGVSRSDLTAENVRAVVDQHLGYVTLKAMARASLEHAFVPGESLWHGGIPGDPAPACASPSAPSCAALLARSERARLQQHLETELAAFEGM